MLNAARRLLVIALALVPVARGLPAQRTENVVLVTLDGLRWQEVFGGADPALVNAEAGGIKDLLAFRRQFWRGEPEARRQVLLPFFWDVIAKEGQLFGDPARGCEAVVTNPHHFSYPGYHELLCGFVDERIDSNAKRPNPNRTVFEWLHGMAGYEGRVAAFCTWDVFPYILNAERAGFYVHACHDPIEIGAAPAALAGTNALVAALPRYFADCAFDAVAMTALREYLAVSKPRLIYLALGETDCWAHERRYDLYLAAARHSDRYLAELWRTLQGIDQYAGKTTLIVTCDHGRGDGREWTDHNSKTAGAERVWFAVLGPDTPSLGVRRDVRVTQAQTAATVAHMLGHDWPAEEPRAAVALPGVR